MLVVITIKSVTFVKCPLVNLLGLISELVSYLSFVLLIHTKSSLTHSLTPRNVTSPHSLAHIDFRTSSCDHHFSTNYGLSILVRTLPPLIPSPLLSSPLLPSFLPSFLPSLPLAPSLSPSLTLPRKWWAVWISMCR